MEDRCRHDEKTFLPNGPDRNGRLCLHSQGWDPCRSDRLSEKLTSFRCRKKGGSFILLLAFDSDRYGEEEKMKTKQGKIEYLEKALEILHKMEFNDRNDQIQSFVSALMVDSSVQSLGRERVTYDYDSAYSSSSSSSSSDSSEEKEEYKEVKTTYINFRDGSKGVVVDDDSLSSYKGQLVVNEYTKEPTGMRYKDDHLYDEDGNDLGWFDSTGSFYSRN